MDKKQFQKYDNQAKVLKALAHPTRLFIVDQLKAKELCVCEITAMVGADMSTISKHLSILKEAGIVGVEKRGTNVYYTLKIPCAATFMTCVKDVIKNRFDEQFEMIKE
jgi:DNA-binding transcriptional ArsR family regulator